MVLGLAWEWIWWKSNGVGIDGASNEPLNFYTFFIGCYEQQFYIEMVGGLKGVKSVNRIFVLHELTIDRF